jgi:hypothetical protein
MVVNTMPPTRKTPHPGLAMPADMAEQNFSYDVISQTTP